jgi:hypothetical protein
VLGLAVPAIGLAANKPSVSTRSATHVSTNAATLNGFVNPRGRPTTYFFQYGPSTAYGAETPKHSAGNGTSAIKFAGGAGKLAPGTTYHFRIVATSDAGTAYGADRKFATKETAPGVSLTASPATVVYGRGMFLTGRLVGTRVAGRPVVLEQRGFPYKAHFQKVGTPKLTDASGGFGFGIAPMLAPLQFRVVTGDSPKGTSPIVTVPVAVRIRTNVSSRVVRAHRRVLFSGTVRPAMDGTQFAIQRRRAGLWVTVAGGTLTHNDSSSSQYAMRVGVAHSSFYRVYVRAAGNGFAANVGRRVHIRIRHR